MRDDTLAAAATFARAADGVAAGLERMTLAAFTAITNVVTLIMLLVGAVAALIQLRHLRAANVLASMLAVEARFAEPELQRALLSVQDELGVKLADPRYRAELTGRGYIDTQAHPEMTVCNWFNELATMVEGEFLDEDVFFDSYGRLVEYYWRLAGPAIVLLRRERGSDVYAGFGRLARRAADWRRKHGNAGIYPARAVRTPPADPWAGSDRDAGPAAAPAP